MIAIDLSKQQVLDADPKAIQQIKFTGTLHPAGGNTKYFLHYWRSKRNKFRLFTGTCESITNLFCFNII